MKRIITAIIIAANVVPAGALTIDSVLNTIGRNNLQIQAAEADMVASVCDIKGENTLDAPSVEYSPFFNKAVSGVVSSELVVSQEFDFPTLYAARSKSGRLQARVLESEVLQTRREILLEAKQKCLQMILLENRRTVLTRRKEVSDRLQELYSSKYESGAATILDLNRVRMEVMQLKADISDNESAIRRVNVELMAMNGNKPIDIAGMDYPDIASIIAASGNRQRLVESDAGVISAQASVLASRQEVSVSRQGWLPKISLGYRRNTEIGDANNGFLVGLSIPVFSNGNKVKAANSRLTASQLKMENAVILAESLIDADMAELENLLQLMEIYDLDLMNQTLTLLEKAVELGNMAVVDYYVEADQIYLKMQEYLDLENRYHVLAANLLRNTL